LAACGGGGGGGTSGSSTDAAKGFMDAFAALDATKMKTFLCTAQAAAADGLSAGFSQAGVETKLDASGLTYTTSESGDSATVTIAGNMKVTAAGVSQDIPVSNMFPDGKLQMTKEGGAWKVCPAAP
ncbi:MAG TPA: hypothetical protein VHL11_01245, partial [Phototrophicaceae bacterium]|nr:hypothetical protein [Phototrophicaceae bacterium]